MQNFWTAILAFFGLTNTIQLPAGSIPVTPTPHPFSITALSVRTYDTNLVIQSQARTTSTFTSHIASYDSDGLKQYSLLNKPIGQTPTGGWPVVIVNHGYIDPDVYSTPNSYINTSAYFASAGFVVLKPDYRGHANSEGEAGSLTSRINYAVDVLNLLSAIKKLDYVNPDRIYMYGHSMGGDVTLRVIEACPTCIKAASLWAPAVTDWPESFMFFARRNPQDTARIQRRERFQKELSELFKPEDFSSVSTLANVSLVQIPVNIHHGTNDESVPYEWGTQLKEKLELAGKTVNFYSYQNANHDISSHWSPALNRDIELFKAH